MICHLVLTFMKLVLGMLLIELLVSPPKKIQNVDKRKILLITCVLKCAQTRGWTRFSRGSHISCPGLDYTRFNIKTFVMVILH